MRRTLIVILVVGVVLSAKSPPVVAHGGDVDVVVEARASDPRDDLHTDYALMLMFADGDPVVDAEISAQASDGSAIVSPIEVGSAGGLHIIHFVFPEPGTWQLDLAIDHADGALEITLIEAVPLGDSGTQVVRLDTADESQTGAAGRFDIPDHPLAEPSKPAETPASRPSTTMAATPQETTEPTISSPLGPTETTIASPTTRIPVAEPSHGAMVKTTTSGVISLPTEFMMRWAHLGMITVWGLAVLAMAVRIDHRLLPTASLGGLAGTLASGLVLGLWATPVGYPGIFRWSDLNALEYGAAWQSSFLIKMGGVALAIAGTFAATRRKGWGARLGVAGMGVSLIAVTALSQFHLLTHS